MILGFVDIDIRALATSKMTIKSDGKLVLEHQRLQQNLMLLEILF